MLVYNVCRQRKPPMRIVCTCLPSWLIRPKQPILGRPNAAEQRLDRFTGTFQRTPVGSEGFEGTLSHSTPRLWMAQQVGQALIQFFLPVHLDSAACLPQQYRQLREVIHVGTKEEGLGKDCGL